MTSTSVWRHYDVANHHRRRGKFRGVAHGPVGPAVAGPIISQTSALAKCITDIDPSLSCSSSWVRINYWTGALFTRLYRYFLCSRRHETDWVDQHCHDPAFFIGILSQYPKLEEKYSTVLSWDCDERISYLSSSEAYDLWGVRTLILHPQSQCSHFRNVLLPQTRLKPIWRTKKVKTFPSPTASFWNETVLPMSLSLEDVLLVGLTFSTKFG